MKTNLKTKTTTPSARNSISPATAGRGFILIVLALACFALSPTMQAAPAPKSTLYPPPDGGYPGYNTAEGDNALFSLTTGLNNTAIGFQALFRNTTGGYNTAIGTSALVGNTTGDLNTATGVLALADNVTGTRNTATGVQSLSFNTTGSRNTATGFAALETNETGDHNAAYGWVALFNNNGSLNIALGDGAGEELTSGDNNIDIGNIGVAGEANTIRIGTQVFTTTGFGLNHPAHTATYIAGISGTTVAGGVTVVVDTDGHLGTIVSSERYKDEIKPMNQASEAILALRPVTFRYKKELDPESIPQFGLVAEEVEKVNPALVARDAAGKVYTVRYEAVNAMLLNEFIKQHRKVEQQEATISQLKSTVAQQQKGMEVLTASLKEQVSQIQKVSAQVELRKPAPQIVANKQ